MGPLPITANGPKFPTHCPHRPISTLHHQNLPNCNPLADSLKIQDPTLFYNALTTDWQPQLKPDDTKSWTRLQYKFSLIISAYEIYRALIEFIYRLTRSYHTYFWSNLIFSRSYYIFLDLIYLLYLWYLPTCALSRIANAFLCLFRIKPVILLTRFTYLLS